MNGPSSIHTSFDVQQILQALNRIATYKDVIWQQRTSGGAEVTFARVNYNIGSNVLGWTNMGNGTIYIPAINWGTWKAGQQGMVVHELGHRFGSGGHGTDGIMRAVMVDPQCNFTRNDFQSWYRLPDKSGPRPWEEPNRWRMTTARAIENWPVDRPTQLAGYSFGHPSLFRRFLHMFENHEVSAI